MQVTIRQASPEDLDLLVRWRMEVLQAVFSASDNVFPEDLEEQNRAYYRSSLADGSHIACFALVDDEIVGCGGLCLQKEMPSPDNPTGRCAYLMNIYCRPAHRNQGVGDAVVRWLVERARESDITKIYLETTDEGRKLYAKIGFADMQDMMILPTDVVSFASDGAAEDA